MAYHLQERKDPRPNRVHVLRVDLSTGKTIPVVVIGDDPDGDGPAETALTHPLKLAADSEILAVINTNPWSALPDALGCVSDALNLKRLTTACVLPHPLHWPQRAIPSHPPPRA